MTNETAKSYLTVIRESYIYQLEHLKGNTESIFYCSEYIQALSIAIKRLSEQEGGGSR